MGRAEKVAEEEQLVFLDGAADGAAEIVVRDVAHARIEVGASIHRAVLYVFGRHPMKLIGAGLENYVTHGTDGAAQFGFVVGSRDIYGGDGLLRRNHDLQKAGSLIVVDSLDLIAVAHARLTVDLGLNRGSGVEELRMLKDR